MVVRKYMQVGADNIILIYIITMAEHLLLAILIEEEEHEK